MLSIFLDSIYVDMYIGVYEWEKKRLSQRIYISVKVNLKEDSSAYSDSLDDTIDYEELQNNIIEMLQNKHVALIEHVAQKVHHLVCENSKVDKAFITVSKPSALDKTKNISVEFTK